MSLLLETIKDKLYMWWCPACKTHHPADITKWNFDGNFESPTFAPSFLTRSTKLTEKGKQEYKEWCEAGYHTQDNKPFDSKEIVCHTFIRNGQIEYLNDCTHEYAGKTIPMEDID